MAKKTSRAAAVMGGKKSHSKSSKHKVHKMHIHRAADNRYIVEHEMAPGNDGEMPPPQEPHAMNGMDELLSHVQQNMGSGEPDGDEGGGSPAPGQAAPQPQAQG